MESFIIIGKAKQVFDLIALKAKVEQARLARQHLEEELKEKGGQDAEHESNDK